MQHGIAPGLLQGIAFLLLLSVFFLSGASALVYQVVWTRQLALVFGVTLYAISAVLATFMAGLALGSFLAGRMADRLTRPLVWYAGIEALIAACGAASIVVMSVLTPAYVWFYGVTGGAGPLVVALRFGAACLVLLVPAALMGATLPVIVRASLVLLPHAGKNLSLLYALNTAGAACGALAAGFLLIERLGLHGAVLVAAAGNIAVGVAALLLQAALTAAGKADVDPTGGGAVPVVGGLSIPPAGARAVLLAMGVSGFCALAYEVLWFRVLDLFLNGTVYAFSLMLFTFLFGLAVGSVAVRLIIGLGWNWVVVLGVFQALVGLVTLGSFHLVVAVPDVLGAMAQHPELAGWLKWPIAVMTVVALLVLLPLTVLLGSMFPLAAQALIQGRADAGYQIGRLTAVNTAGAILGSLAAGFWMVPMAGSQTSLVLLAVVNGALATLLLWAGGLAAQPRWRMVLLAPGTAFVFLLGGLPDLVPETLRRIAPHHRILWLEEGLENTVSVQARPEGVRLMFLNSRHQTSDAPAQVRYHALIGTLPMVLHPDPRDVLVIGLGGGATAGAASRFPLAQLDVIELSPSVVRAAEQFRHINHDVLRQKNVRVIVDDGRNYLLLTSKKYDVITADIIHMQHAGAGNVYSREYFQIAKQALKEDGVMLQWASHWTEGVYYPHIVRTFLSVFPYVTFWHHGSLMAGSLKPMDVSAAALARRYERAEVRAATAGGPIPTAEALLREYYGDHEQMRAFVGAGPLVTDSHPFTEFFRALPGGDSHAAGVTPKGR